MWCNCIAIAYTPQVSEGGQLHDSVVQHKMLQFIRTEDYRFITENNSRRMFCELHVRTRLYLSIIINMITLTENINNFVGCREAHQVSPSAPSQFTVCHTHSCEQNYLSTGYSYAGWHGMRPSAHCSGQFNVPIHHL